MLSAASCFTTRCSQRLHFNKIKFYCFNQRHCSVKYGHVFENGKCLAVKDQGAFSWHHLALCWGSCFTQEAFAAPLGFRTATGRWSPVALIKLACPLRFQGLLGIHGPHLYAGNHKSRGPFIHSLEPSYQFYLAMSQFGFLFLLTNRAPPPRFLSSVCVCKGGEREREKEVLFCMGKGTHMPMTTSKDNLEWCWSPPSSSGEQGCLVLCCISWAHEHARLLCLCLSPHYRSAKVTDIHYCI